MIWERERKRKRETMICFSTYWCIHWLSLLCALTGDWTCNLGTSDDALTNWTTWPGLEHTFFNAENTCPSSFPFLKCKLLLKPLPVLLPLHQSSDTSSSFQILSDLHSPPVDHIYGDSLKHREEITLLSHF